MGTMDLAMTMVKFFSRVLFMMIENKKKEKIENKNDWGKCLGLLVTSKGLEGH